MAIDQQLFYLEFFFLSWIIDKPSFKLFEITFNFCTLPSFTFVQPNSNLKKKVFDKSSIQQQQFFQPPHLFSSFLSCSLDFASADFLACVVSTFALLIHISFSPASTFAHFFKDIVVATNNNACSHTSEKGLSP